MTTTPLRRIGFGALLGLLVVTAVACGDEPSSFDVAHVESSAPYQRPTDEQAAEGAAIVRRVAGQLYGPLAEAAGTDANVVYAPLSIATTLGQARGGAAGPSADELDAFFGVDDATDLHAAIRGPQDHLGTIVGPVELQSGELGEIQYSSADALWGQSGVTFEQPFLDLLSSRYDASVWTADFAQAPEKARTQINSWVAERTADKIPDLLPEGSVTDATRVVLTNAVHLKVPWFDELDVDEKPTPFTTAAGEVVQVPMLRVDGDLVRAEGAGWQSVTLPYAGEKLALTLIVPDAGKLAAVEDLVADGVLDEALRADDVSSIALAFPAFTAEQRADLAGALRSQGVEAPFATEDDFLPITKDPVAQPLALASVQHAAWIAVDEHGTEAAAATGATFETVGGRLADEELIVDRPFLFVVHDVRDGTPLFVGRIADPTVSS